MRTVRMTIAALAIAVAARAAPLRCAPDAVKVGTACVDKYEASVWQIDTANKSLLRKVQQGKVTREDLIGNGAIQLGCAYGAFNLADYPLNFPLSGNWTPVFGTDPPTPGVYAVSIAGVLPSTCVSWFQANQACQLSGKRLVTNREWQGAAAGTPDAGGSPGASDCNTNSAGPSSTGSRLNCVSNWGAFDMVGNVAELVAEWAELSVDCTDWTAGYPFPGVGFPGAGDTSCFGGPGNFDGVREAYNLPASLVRGGYWGAGAATGVFAVEAYRHLPDPLSAFGFRCAR